MITVEERRSTGLSVQAASGLIPSTPNRSIFGFSAGSALVWIFQPLRLSWKQIRGIFFNELLPRNFISELECQLRPC